ncbi:hypothetical protein PHYPSEUDO_004863 [Phytophthora pseudosyringae]|uniref:Uncharacterized protein n=1 Tax=Phytophthora pseudosyringae TaxID=221518 RepID=A0A8T1VMB7_9STRA|nr:hypothetical protein PHYPSEUDO_004863 [Phytophthora pseudosyringae]
MTGDVVRECVGRGVGSVTWRRKDGAECVDDTNSLQFRMAYAPDEAAFRWLGAPGAARFSAICAAVTASEPFVARCICLRSGSAAHYDGRTLVAAVKASILELIRVLFAPERVKTPLAPSPPVAFGGFVVGRRWDNNGAATVEREKAVSVICVWSYPARAVRAETSVFQLQGWATFSALLTRNGDVSSSRFHGHQTGVGNRSKASKGPFAPSSTRPHATRSFDRVTRQDLLPRHKSLGAAMGPPNLHLRGLSVDVVALVASFAWDLDSASAAGHLEVVQLLLHLRRSSPVRCSFRALNAAAQNGFLAVVRALHESGIASGSTFAMNMAAANGHLAMVQFLHFHRPEGCTSYAMDAAAAKGHLDIVKFLHFHRTEGCTTAAMDLGAARGHLHVVEFLHRYRTEGATVAAIDRAAQNGHLRVVQFCREARPEGFTHLAIRWASANGHTDVVRYLQPSRGRRSALGALLQDGRLLVC